MKNSDSLSENGTIMAVASVNVTDQYDEYCAGQVTVYKYNSISHEWDPIGGTLYGAQNSFGWSVSLSADANILAVGAPNYSFDNLKNGWHI